ncbi:transposase [Pseudomonas stutzeri]|uniref:REP-associated tyrosine transposase n=1 Tax=Stutzerimonas stutzeri TaxID=316 RepID=UPI00210A529D|nr:transposase [Stutzerimonas stutzeri]MCQ4307927.1 transposase [Stutzerimonas stutzeri]
MRFHGRDLRKGRVNLPGHTYVLTCVTLNRTAAFAEWSSASLLAQEIHRIGQSDAIRPLAWVVMPDHLHWLVQLEAGSLNQLMQRLKSRSAIALNRLHGTRGAIWQKGYHDRAVRNEEDLRNVARYIVANPLRAGLVKRIGDYPFWDAAWL